MSLTAEQKGQIIDQYKQADGDTGSPEVQIALLMARRMNNWPHSPPRRELGPSMTSRPS